jgi:hypothetical protein
LITIPWVQSDLRREKKAWAENRGQGGILWVDDISAPTARTRFASVQERFTPWTRDKQSAPSTPSVDGTNGPSQSPEVTTTATDGASHNTENMPDGVDALHKEKKEGAVDLEA